MRRPLDDDLQRWEAGELSLAEIEARHPGQDVEALVGLHARVARLGSRPAPDPEAAWELLRTRLEPRRSETARPRPHRSRRRVVAAVVAVVIAAPAVSYAAAPDAVRAVAREVTDLLPGSDGTDRPEMPDDDHRVPGATVPAVPRGDVGDGDRDGEGEGEGDEPDQVDDEGIDEDDAPDARESQGGRDEDPAAELEEAEEVSASSAVHEEIIEVREEETEPREPDRDGD